MSSASIDRTRVSPRGGNELEKPPKGHGRSSDQRGGPPPGAPEPYVALMTSLHHLNILLTYRWLDALN
jgi:hypothetical protein